MDEQQVRALVRQAIAKHMGSGAGPSSPMPAPVASPRPPALHAVAPDVPGADISQARFHLLRPAGEIECLIEPAVACNHCGYCQCYGH